MFVNYNFEHELEFNYINRKTPFTVRRSAPVRVAVGKKTFWLMIPGGFTSDGCSIPKLLRFFFGCPHTPQYIPASIIHDYILANPKTVNYNRNLASLIFFHALLNEEVTPLKAVLMYLAVDLWQAVKNIWTEKWV